MKFRIGAALAAATLALVSALPAAAAQFVQDGAGMFSESTVSALESRIASFQSQTGKEVAVVTVPSLGGADVQQAAQQAYRDKNVNGVLIYIAKNDHRDYFLAGINESRTGTITGSDLSSIRQSMESSFKAQDFDGGITNAVGSVLSLYHSHLGSLQQTRAATTTTGYGGYNRSYAPATTGGFHLNMFWIIIFVVIGFLILRSIFRSMSGPRYYGGGPVGGAPGGPGYYGGGGPGWGGGYYGGGGGGFWSGLLGGLGGAWLGNELFGGNRGGYYGGGDQIVDPNTGTAPQSTDSGMWQNDAGQFDNSGGSGGDWGSGGFGDSGGGWGGGDSGGGGGDSSGGGW